MSRRRAGAASAPTGARSSAGSRDGQTIGDDKAAEIVAVANRLIAEAGGELFPSDWLVTPTETRLAALEDIAAKLDEVLDRLARLEERLP
jgi:hypothetical protein